MIDLHNHILPGLDDGAADLDESLEIARQFVSEGVTTVAATPHRNPSRDSGQSRSTIESMVASVQRALDDANIGLGVVSGHELYLTPDALQPLEEGDICTLGGTRTVLVELPFDTRPLYLDDAMFRFQLAGFSLILAHPERYAYVQRDVSIVDSLVDKGVVLQITAPALLGYFGPRVRRTAEELLRRGLCALAASDRHHPGGERSLAALHDRIAALTDVETADLLLIENPRRVLAGETPIRPDAHGAEKENILGRVRRRLSGTS